MFSGEAGAGWFFIRGWPIELVLGAAFFCQLMFSQRSYWLIIPAGLLLGEGVLLGYYALSGRWGDWAFLWPLQVFIVLGVLWVTIRGGVEATNLYKMAVLWGKRLRFLAFAVAGLYFVAVVLANWLV